MTDPIIQTFDKLACEIDALASGPLTVGGEYVCGQVRGTIISHDIIRPANNPRGLPEMIRVVIDRDPTSIPQSMLKRMARDAAAAKKAMRYEEAD